jgi:hypothetical protein
MKQLSIATNAGEHVIWKRNNIHMLVNKAVTQNNITFLHIARNMRGNNDI